MNELQALEKKLKGVTIKSSKKGKISIRKDGNRVGARKRDILLEASFDYLDYKTNINN